MTIRCFLNRSAFVLPVFAASAAHAQYNLTILNPSGTDDAEAWGASGGYQAGSAAINGGPCAGLWNGSAGSFVNLSAGYIGGQAFGISGNTQVGYFQPSLGVEHAAMWHGNAASLLDLNPPGYLGSQLNAISGGHQVGWIQQNGYPDLAAVWSGTASSCINLNPFGFYQSDAVAVSGAYQIGFVGNSSGTDYNAALWNGTAASFVNLNPSGYAQSFAVAASGAYQAGEVQDSSGNQYAAMWNGTAASFINLNPSGDQQSDIIAMAGGLEAGWVSTGTNNQVPAVWNGTSAQVTILPSNGFRAAWVQGIDPNGDFVGIGVPVGSSRDDALLWTPAPEPFTVVGLGMGSICVFVRRRARAKTAN